MKETIEDLGSEQLRELQRLGPPTIEHMLVCLDRSKLSESCIPHAVALAKVFDARVTLLHVMEAPQEAAASPAPDPLAWEIGRREVQTYLDSVRDRTEAFGPTTRTIIAQGLPAARIVSVAADIGADLTVIGSHGASGRLDPLLGTTVQHVLALTHGSVFVARSSPPTGGAIAPRRILVPLDGSTRTECVLPTAARIARTHAAELVLVHVVPEPLPSAILAGEDLDRARDLARRLEDAAARYLERIAGALAHGGLAVHTVVQRESDERQALLSVAEREHVDLMVVSAHGTTCNAARPFGTMASYLLSYARASLLVIQDLREGERLAEAHGENEHHAAPLRGVPHTGPVDVA